MKSKFFSIIVVVAFVSLSGYGVYKNQQKNVLSDVMLANLEALANDGESGGRTLICYTTFTPADWFHEDQYFVNCVNCMTDKGRDLRDRSECNAN